MKTINTYYEDYQGLKKFVEDNHEIFFSKSNSAVLVQVFCGICDKDYIFDLTKQICELIPDAWVLGATTGGEIMNGAVSGLKTALSFSVFYHTNIKSVMLSQKDNNAYELGRAVATKLKSKKAALLIMFATGLAVNASHLLKGVQAVNPYLPISGGNAGDNFTNKQDYVFCNEGVISNGVVAIVLESVKLKVNHYRHLCWQPIGKEMTITKAEGLRVYTIDHIPTYQIYRKYLGKDIDYSARPVSSSNAKATSARFCINSR